MGSATEYQRRAENCLERAQTLTNRVDRARWLQLAEQWSALSRMPLPSATLLRNRPTGFWRGEPSPPNSKSLEAALPVMKKAPPIERRGQWSLRSYGRSPARA
jgi:hypothetical protein